MFDLSIYPKDAKLFDPNNEKVVGKTKDESRGEINDEFVGLKSKMYSIKDADGEEIKKQIESIKMLLKTKDKEFVGVLFNEEVVRHIINRIQSELHTIGTYDICKISLSCFDDK